MAKTLTLSPHQERALDVMAGELTKLVEFGTGTGKSAVMVRAAKLFTQNGEGPGVMIVPNSLLDQMYEQFELWAGEDWTDRNVCLLDRTRTIYQRRQELRAAHKQVYLLGTEALSYPQIREGLTRHRWGWVIIDEASRYRNWSKRTGTLKLLGSRANSRYAFTGNLIVRNPSDCFYVTDWLEPGCWGTRQRDAFVKKYFLLGGFSGIEPVGLRPDMARDFLATYNTMRIHCELRDVRTLPDRVLEQRKTALSGPQQRAYAQMRTELRVMIERVGEPEFHSKASTYATRLMRLQEIASGFTRNTDGEYVLLPSPKTREMVETLLDDPETPTIIWYWFRPENELIQRELTKAGLPFSWFGNKNARQDFQSGKVNIFLAQMAKGGFGLNLQRATRMMYHCLPWDLDVYTQSQERNMRLDTPDPKKGFLEIIHYTVENSCEEYVRDRLIGKANMSRKFSRSQALELLR